MQLVRLNANTLPETAAFFHRECGLGGSVEEVLNVEPELVGISLKTLGLAPFPQLHTLRIKEVEPGFHPVY